MGFWGWVSWGRSWSQLVKTSGKRRFTPPRNHSRLAASGDLGVSGGRARMGDLRAAVEATLLGKDERLVAKCDVPGLLAVFERWDIYDVVTLSPNLASSFAELQRDLAPVAALSFLALLKATIGDHRRAASLRVIILGATQGDHRRAASLRALRDDGRSSCRCSR